MAKPTTSFTTKKINPTTFVVREDDIYEEHPLIYAKLHPRYPLIILSDTGCDEPSKEHRGDRFTHLREYLEHYPIPANNDRPLNPHGKLQYLIILTHCHYDHTNGIVQFLRGGTTEIICSAAGREFIESDLETHGQYKRIGIPTPYFQVTHYAESFERLQWPFHHSYDNDETSVTASSHRKQHDLGITIISTPGHTPDELAWYDHKEMHLSCGDSFYEEGSDGMPIIFPSEGNLIEWVFSMQKLLVFVRSENARAAKEAESASVEEDGWTHVAPRVQVSCAHQTSKVDGEAILAALEKFAARVYAGQVPVVRKKVVQEETYLTWRDADGQGDQEFRMSIQAPARLMQDARTFFNLRIPRTGDV